MVQEIQNIYYQSPIFFLRDGKMLMRDLNIVKHQTLQQIWNEIENEYPIMSFNNPNFVLEFIQNNNRIHLDRNKTPHQLELTLIPCGFVCVE